MRICRERSTFIFFHWADYYFLCFVVGYTPFPCFFFYFDCVDFNLSWLDRIALRNLCVCFLSLPLASPPLFIFYVDLKHWSLRCRGGFGGHDGLLRLFFLCVLNGGHEKGVDASFPSDGEEGGLWIGKATRHDHAMDGFFLGLFTITVIITCVICANANMPGGGWRSLSLRCTVSRQRQRDGLAGCWLELGTTGRDGRSKKKEEVLHVPIKSRCKLN